MPLSEVQWNEVQTYVAQGHSFVEAGKEFSTPEFEVKPNSIMKRAKRHGWVTSKHVKAAINKQLHKSIERSVAKVATDWATRGEELRAVTFDKAHKSIQKFQIRAPKSFRELESAAKVARQAAGLDTADVQIATLIQLNERMENFADEQPIEDNTVVEAVIVDESVAS